MVTIHEQLEGFPQPLVWAAERVQNTCEQLTAHLVAVIVKGGAVIGWASNTPKLNVYTVRNAVNPDCSSTHAEVRAIFKARKKSDLRGCRMYVARVTKENLARDQRARIGLAKPCAACMKTIADYGIKRVVYTIGPRSFGTLCVTDSASRRRSKGARKLPHS